MTTELTRMARADDAVRRFEAAAVQMNSLRVVTPDDLPGHRERFVRDWERGRPRDPHFTYQEAPDDGLRAATALLTDIKRLTDPWHRLVQDEAHNAVELFRACADHDSDRITGLTVRANGRPDAALLTEAHAVLSPHQGTADTDVGGLDAASAASVLTEILDACGLSDWTVLIKADMAARMSVLAARRQINLRSDLLVSVEGLVHLTMHEIGTHVFRSVNARRGPRILHLRLPGHTATEEGLAVWHEQTVAGATNVDPRFALRVIAVHRALTGSFTEVVTDLLPHTGLRTAFDVAVRVKRGLTDTSAPGGYLKDHAYLAGYRMIRSHLEQFPQNYPTLMSTKWPLRLVESLTMAGLPAALPGPLLLPDTELAQYVRSLAEEAAAG
ncbi:DUF1704 domain-containing protein [Streptomyces sp. ME02-8801-2C]|uniref:tyrosine/phenylalanine carboxypeptidase domain-containing protein n=1 Tax=Streptomyces sp. ME02-8801-2C TaxID=3028680 RepID=UPI0029AF1F7C|nr:tyrosine/phenylalanine carboxypeptidase domain-containing protein [Streptomyces sp. ME02-8801-2C]MDX3455461.1 DUF1704 domain-containing protein [Streptomyces sp. ME02-8801-2C]